MLSRDSGKTESVLTPLSATKPPVSPREDGRRTPDYFGPTTRSIAGPGLGNSSGNVNGNGNIENSNENDSFGLTARYQPPQRSFSSPRPPQQVSWASNSTYYTRTPQKTGYEDMNPLGMNRI